MAGVQPNATKKLPGVQFDFASAPWGLWFFSIYLRVVYSCVDRRVMSYLDIEACATPTTARCQGVVHDLELRPNQFHGEVDLASLQQFQRGQVQDDLGRRQVSRRRALVGGICEYRVVLADGSGGGIVLCPFRCRGSGRVCLGRHRWGQGHELHEILKAVAAAALDLDSEGEEGVRVFGHDLGEALWMVGVSGSAYLSPGVKIRGCIRLLHGA